MEIAPVWYDPLSPLGSAVRYVASLSPHFNWVGISVAKKSGLVLGPFIGPECETTGKSQLVVLIQNAAGKVLGQIDIKSHTLNTFGLSEEEAVRHVSKELGVLWPEPEKRSRR